MGASTMFSWPCAPVPTRGMHEASDIDPWFLDQMQLIHEFADELRDANELDAQFLRRAKRHGFSDCRSVASSRGDESRRPVAKLRDELGVQPVYKTVDTCAAEFEAVPRTTTPVRRRRTKSLAADKPRRLILGSGPNRIGQGIEFDYSCVHAALTLREAGYETVMVNCNPETVSTDYDTSDRLYFEPLTAEDVMAVYRAEVQAGPVLGVICQLGGQTPLGLAQTLKDQGVPVVGTSARGDPPG